MLDGQYNKDNSKEKSYKDGQRNKDNSKEKSYKDGQYNKNDYKVKDLMQRKKNLKSFSFYIDNILIKTSSI